MNTQQILVHREYELNSKVKGAQVTQTTQKLRTNILAEDNKTNVIEDLKMVRLDKQRIIFSTFLKFDIIFFKT